MVRQFTLLASFAAIFSYSTIGEAASSSKTEESKVSAMTECQKVHALIKEHKNQFKRVVKSKHSTQFADIWTVKYKLVGDDCKVVRWGANKSSYSCMASFPGKNVALEKYESAKVNIQKCLGPEWKLNERARYNAPGMVAVFMKKGEKTTVATHAFETNGIFKEQWTNYFFVGNKKRLQN